MHALGQACSTRFYFLIWKQQSWTKQQNIQDKSNIYGMNVYVCFLGVIQDSSYILLYAVN